MMTVSSLIIVVLLVACAVVHCATKSSNSKRHYCEGQWVDFSSAADPFLNYTLHAARTTYDYADPKQTLLNYKRDACPAQVARFSCYMRSDDVQRSRKQEEIHFVPSDRRACAPFTPRLFLDRIRHRRVFLLGDSVMSQIWTSLVCALHREEESYVHRDVTYFPIPCRRSSPRGCPIAPNPNSDNHDDHRNPQFAHLTAGFAKFRQSNASVFFLSHNRVHDRPVAQQIARQRLTSEDVVVFAFGLHYQPADGFQKDMQWLADWIAQQTSPPHFLLLHTPPQHFDESDGYFNATKGSDPDTPSCFPLKGWKDKIVPLSQFVSNSKNNNNNNGSTEQSTFSPGWKTIALEDAFRSLAEQKKVSIVPISSGLNTRHDAHLGWGDCTHWCFPSDVFKYVHLMMYNALRRVIQQHRKSNTPLNEDNDDISWKLHPALKNGDLVQFTREKSIFYVEKGKFREFQSWDAFVSHGFDISQIVRLERYEHGPEERGDPIFPDSVLSK